MKKFLYLVIFWSYTFNCVAQQYNDEEDCGSDTITTYRREHLVKINVHDTASYFRAVRCTKVSKFGVRVDIGISGYSYNYKTKQWLGNHRGPLIGLMIVYDKLNFGFRFKPWTVNPKKELTFQGDTLTTEALVNPVKLDYSISYSIDFKYNISIEPYIGLTQNIFEVINEDELKKSFKIPNSNGFITGISLNKYLQIKEFQFLTIFINCGYSFVNFTKTNDQLDLGYLEWAMGIGYKGFGKSYFLKRVH